MRKFSRGCLVFLHVSLCDSFSSRTNTTQNTTPRDTNWTKNDIWRAQRAGCTNKVRQQPIWYGIKRSKTYRQHMFYVVIVLRALCIMRPRLLRIKSLQEREGRRSFSLGTPVAHVCIYKSVNRVYCHHMVFGGLNFGEFLMKVIFLIQETCNVKIDILK